MEDQIPALSTLWESFLSWHKTEFWTLPTLIEAIVIVIGAGIALTLYTCIRARAMNTLKSSNLPATVHRVGKNLIRLIPYIIALSTIFIGSLIAEKAIPDHDPTLVFGVMKILFAWIVIRILVLFIANRGVRNLFAITIWAIAALSIMGVLDQAISTLDAIGFSIGDSRLSALAVIKGVLLIFALLYFAIFSSTFIERRILQTKSLTRSSQVLISKISRVCLIVFALLIGITTAGIDLSLFAVFGGAIGLGIGFGLQKGISNLFSGMLLLMDRSIKPGDVIEIPDIGTFGWVNQMAARYTEIVTRDNKSFLIPNEDFITQRVINWSHGNSLIRLKIDFGVHYDSDPHHVKKIAEEAAKDLERVIDSPAPVCWLVEFGDSALNFSLRFWIKDAEAGITNIKGMVMMAIWDAFKEEDIQIPYPHREVYLHEAKD